MSVFPETPSTLLTRLAARAEGTDESSWARFFELYQPAKVRFVAQHCRNGAVDPEDVVQEVLVRLVDLLREGCYERGRGRFRSLLAVMLRNELYSAVRALLARPEGRAESLADVPASDRALHVPSLTEAALDAAWRQARHEAAIEHVFAHTALSAQSKRIFRELDATGDSCEAVARRLNFTPAAVRQVKSRVTRLIAALEKLTQLH